MKKRFILWSIFLALMLIIVITMVWMAEKGATEPGINNSDKNVIESPNLLLNENDRTRGNQDADVVVVKYSDFQCSACRAYASFDHFLYEEIGKDVLLVYRYFPLRNFKFSRLAAMYAEAAGRQGKFWEMHDLLYINQPNWQYIQGTAEPVFKEFAEDLNLDMEQFNRDLKDPSLAQRIISDYEKGLKLGVNSVPSIFINGELIRNPSSFEEYRALVESYAN